MNTNYQDNAGCNQGDEAEQMRALSSSQTRLWFLDQLSPQQALYNLTVRYQLSGDIRLDLLDQSLTALVRRHRTLRTSYHGLRGVPFQRVNLPMPIHIAVSTDADYEGWLRNHARRPFNLAESPMLRAGLVIDSSGVHHFTITMHHIAVDAWSLKILDRELWTIYASLVREQTPELPPLIFHYADYAEEEQRRLSSGAMDGDLKYWIQKLDGLTYSQLPNDANKVSFEGSAGASVECALSRGLVDRLEAFARSRHCTLFVVLQAVLAVLLNRYTSSRDVVTGTATAGRVKTGLEPLVGYFVNLLVLKITLENDMTFDQVLLATRDTVFDALDHQSLPFDVLVQELRPTRVSERNPLFQVVLQLHYSNETAAQRVENMEVLRRDAIGSGSNWFEIMFEAIRTKTDLTLTLAYSRDRFEPSRITDLLDGYVASIEHLIDDPSTRLCDLNF